MLPNKIGSIFFEIIFFLRVNALYLHSKQQDMNPEFGDLLEIIGIIIFLGFIYKSLFGCFHKWEFVREVGITYQQMRCKKCGKLKIIDQE